MVQPALALTDIVAVDLGVEVFRVRDRVVGLSAKGSPFSLEDVDPAGLRRVLELADGHRSVAEIASELSSEYDREDVIALLDQLVGAILRVAPAEHTTASTRVLAMNRVLIVGSGVLADAIEPELTRLGITEIELLGAVGFESCESPAFVARSNEIQFVRSSLGALAARPAVSVDVLASRFAGQQLVICALESVPGQALLDVNEAALRAHVPTLFVTVERGVCVVGPLLIPWRSPCFACSRLSTTLRSQFEDIGPDILPFLSFGSLALDTESWLAPRVGFEVGAEAKRALAGGPYPRRLGSLFYLEPTGETRIVEIGAVTTCPACRGHLRAQILDSGAPTPPITITRSAADVGDHTGGVRVLKPEAAALRAQQALEVLQVDIDCRPLPSTAPEALLAFDCPFYRAHHVARFAATAPIVFARFRDTCFGKGTTEMQARCSALFEWFERNLADWRGDRDLVRASYDQLEGRAIDVPFFASGFLPAFPLKEKRVFRASEKLDWVWGHCLRTGKPILLPAAAVFFDGPLFLGSDLELPNLGSSGLSAGCSVAEAILQGLLEIVERDATYTALRTGVMLPEIDPASITEPAVRALLARVAEAGYEAHVREITSDVGIPVIEVYLLRPAEYTFHYASGYGAHLDPEIALRRAVTEAAQGLFFAASTDSEDVFSSHSSFFEVFPHRKHALERKGPKRRFSEIVNLAGAQLGIWQQIDRVVERITAAIPRADVCAVDLSHPALEGVHVVRTFFSGGLDEVRAIQVHVPERCRLVPLEQMYLGRVSL